MKEDECFLLDANELDKIAITRGVAAGLVAVISIMAAYIVVLRVFCCSRHVEQSQDFFPHEFCTLRCVLNCVCNPFLWVVFAYVLTCLAYTAHLWVSFNPDGEVCRWFGYTIQWSESFAMAMSAFLSVYIFYYILSYGKPLTDNELNTQELSSRPRYILHAIIVAAIVLLLFFGTAGYNLPLLVRSYGPEAGPWCWIENETDQLHFWHYPYWSVQFFTLMAMVTNVVLFMCKIARKKAITGKMTAFAIILILIYAQILHGSFAAFESIVKLVPSLRCNEATHIFWYIDSIMTPLAKLLTISGALVWLATKPLAKIFTAEFQPLI